MEALWTLWDEHFKDRPGHHHRLWLESRLAYKIQELAFGGLKPSTRRKLEKIGETVCCPAACSVALTSCCLAPCSPEPTMMWNIA